MIKVFFPPGCYGTYLTRCLYSYTNLNHEPFIKFDFDQEGSSHQHCENLLARSVIKQGHLETLEYDSTSQVVVIVPCETHGLDYYNNQFFKQQHGQIVQYILKQLSLEDIRHKLDTYWNYKGNFDETVPKWIMREWCSFWIADVLNAAYNPTKYSTLNSMVQLSTQDIFENYRETLATVVSALGLTLEVDQLTIDKQHKKFIQVQRFHNIQNRCHQYVHDLFNDIDSNILVYSIFDEAYIQHLLRQHNLEIQCDGLNIFPTSTENLKSITYETMHNTNQR